MLCGDFTAQSRILPQTTFSIYPASGTQIIHKYVQWYLDNHLMEDSKHFKTMLAVTVLLRLYLK